MSEETALGLDEVSKKGFIDLEAAWDEVARLSNHIKEDNCKINNVSEYPIGMRETQITSLRSLLNLISSYHKEM